MSGATQSSELTPEAVTAICEHMNNDHTEDSLLIVRALGGCPDATAARMTGVTVDSALFEATLDDADTASTHEVQVPWSEPITQRAQVRAEVVRMYTEACAALGIEPRPAAEH